MSEHNQHFFGLLRCRPACVALFLLLAETFAVAQCVGRVESLEKAAICTAQQNVSERKVLIDPSHSYRLIELIDIAETTNPKTRRAWEAAKQEAERRGIARSAYFPVLTLQAFFGDERIVNPFPKPLAPRGYVMAELPKVEPLVSMDYVIFDFGRRASTLERSKAMQLAASAAFLRANQEVAFAVVQSYYDLVTAQQKLKAAQQILATAQATEDAAVMQLQNGRGTLPDVLHAKASTARAAYDLEAAAGGERIARVALRESLGVEPSDAIQIALPENELIPAAVTETIEQLVDLAQKSRPDLQQLTEKLHAREQELRAAKAENRPSIHLGANAAFTSVWPTSSYGELGFADQATWAANVKVQWNLFDGGRRKKEEALAESQRRATQDELDEQRDKVSREVWTEYLTFRTAVRQKEAADTLLQAAESSYNASIDAFRYGVKNLIDVVTAERQLAEARVEHVQASSSVWLHGVRLEYVTGSLLRHQKPLVTAGKNPLKLEGER